MDIAKRKAELEAEFNKLTAQREQLSAALEEVKAALFRLQGRFQILDELEQDKPVIKEANKDGKRD